MKKLFSIIIISLFFFACEEEIPVRDIRPSISFDEKGIVGYDTLTISDTAVYIMNISAGDYRLNKMTVSGKDGGFFRDAVSGKMWSGEWGQEGYIDSASKYFFKDTANIAIPDSLDPGDSLNIIFEVTDVKNLSTKIKGLIIIK
jgi:hypothetical protein